MRGSASSSLLPSRDTFLRRGPPAYQCRSARFGPSVLPTETNIGIWLRADRRPSASAAKYTGSVASAVRTLRSAQGVGGRRPVADLIEEELLQRIRAGEFAARARLPGERELAAELRVSRVTLRQALNGLERSGLVRRVPGRSGGTFIVQPKIERDLRHLAGMPAYLRSQGYTAGTRVLSARVLPADSATAKALEISLQAYIYDIVRIRLADGVPISLEHLRIPAEPFPGLLECPLGESMYELMRRRYGKTPAHAIERLEPVLARLDEAEALGILPGVPLLAVERVTYGEGDVPLEYSNDLFRGDRTRVVVPVSDYEAPGMTSEAAESRSPTSKKGSAAE